MLKSLVVTVLIVAVTDVVGEPTDQQLNAKKVELMESTKVVARMGLDVPAAEYTSDDNPDTLEIIFLEKKTDGPSRVSDDGEVIFLYKASDKKQGELIDQAFEIRARRRIGIQGRSD